MNDNPMNEYVKVYPSRDSRTGVPEEAKVGWSSIGPVSAQDALAFASAIQDAAHLALFLNKGTESPESPPKGKR